MNNIIKYWKSAGWILVVLYMSFAPSNSFSPSLFLFEHQDKAFHIIMYAGISFLILNDIREQISAYYKTLILVFFIILAFSSSVEYLQPILSNRTKDFMDIIANTIGNFIGIFLFVIFDKIKKART